LLRVASFRRAVLNTDELHDVESRIVFDAGPAAAIVIDDLKIASPTGATRLAETHVEIKAGDRVLVVGESSSAKTLLFRALAGLWPWGTGHVARPKGDETLYLPRAPYHPPGTLREVLAYPLSTDGFAADAFAPVLNRLDLTRLVPLLDLVRRWDHELSDDEQQSLAFARALLHSPPWILIDDILGALDDGPRQRILDVLKHDLQHAGVVYIGRATDNDSLFSRTLHLVVDADAPKLAAYGQDKRAAEPAH
jgi:putative ATP-binding cassette transporter